MDQKLLKEHIATYLGKTISDSGTFEKDKMERAERVAYYQSWTADKLAAMTEEQFYEFMAKLWAMLIWGNKRYVVDKLIADNSFQGIKKELTGLMWDDSDIEKRWDRFRSKIKGMGPAMMSEILCHTRPEQYVLWNRRAYVGFQYLGVQNLPKYNYQLTGERYQALCEAGKTIAEEMVAQGVKDPTLLTVDYFIWDELQFEKNLSQIHKKGHVVESPSGIDKVDTKTSEFIHNEIRDKIADIGQWLGFDANTETKVAVGSVVDAVWEATIGNMGRVIYVFEVQAKGSTDGLIVNLLKSLNNPAVQGVVAVSDEKQLEKIRKHAGALGELSKKLRYWDYQEVLQNHEALELVNESINRLGLVPQGF